MFDITPDIIQYISTELTLLESLTWGFDYSDLVSFILLLLALERLLTGWQWMLTVFKHDFLPNMANMRGMTFLLLNRPINADGTYLSEFDALGFHRWLDFLSEYVPSTLRYVRYRHWCMKSYKGGDYPRTTGYYNRQTPVEGNWWIKFVDQKADMMYEDDRTPEIHPARGQRSICLVNWTLRIWGSRAQGPIDGKEMKAWLIKGQFA